MPTKTTTLTALLVGSLLPRLIGAVSVWEGPHIDVAENSTAFDWHYIQVVSKTPAENGIPPSIEIVLKHGNPFQYGPSNSPLYLVEVHGFDTDGQRFANTLIFNSSAVTSTPDGFTRGTWANNETTFTAFKNRKSFDLSFNTDFINGTITLRSQSPALTGCGSRNAQDSPYFDQLVADGRSLTTAEETLYKQTGWRITMFAADANVNLAIKGKAVKFTGDGYKNSTWSPNAINNFISAWYVLIANIGPYVFATFSGKATTGDNLINSAHLLYKGQLVSSQCNIIGERQKDISIIRPSGEIADSGVIAPTSFNVTFILPDDKILTFSTTNLAENPSVSVYHRWVATYTGGLVGGKTYNGFGIVEWMNGGNLSHWINCLATHR